MVSEVKKETPAPVQETFVPEKESVQTELEFNEEALDAIVDKAIERKTGARGLRSIIEETMTDIMFEIPSTPNISKCIITKETVLDKQNPEVIQKFGDIYESMYKSKGQNATFNRQQFEAYLEKDAIMLTAIYEEDTPIVFHSYIVGEKQVRLLHSVSEFRNGELDANLVARANKRLHWDDMCLFKKQDKEIYDWGGVSSIENPNGIDAFKFKFGGEPFTYFNVYEGKSLLGKLAIWFMKIKNGKK